MPQASSFNKSYSVHYGHGSLCHSLQEARARAMRRATKVNQGIDKKLAIYQHMISRHQTAELNRKSKVLKRLHQTIVEIEAYKNVLEDMRVDKFRTLEFGFNPREIRTYSSYKRYQTERRVMNVGFSVRSLYPQVMQVIADTDPEKLREADRLKLLGDARKISDFMINRRVTDEALRRELIINDLSSSNDNNVEGQRHRQNNLNRNIESPCEETRSHSASSINCTPLPTLKQKPIVVSKTYVKN